MIRYTRFDLERGSICIRIDGDMSQGLTPWVFLWRNKILSKPGWGTLTVL